MNGRAVAVWVTFLWLAAAPLAWADDVTTLSGTTFRHVRTVRVEPDGVTWEHATGICKVDFTDLPEPVRKEYHYDAGKAAAFHAAQTQVQAKLAAQVQQAQREVEARRVRQYQAQDAPGPAVEGKPGEFVYRRKAADAQIQESVEEGIAAKTAAEAFRTRDDGTIWDRRLWAVPKLIFGGNEFDGVAFDPKTDFNSHEFKTTLHHSPGGFAADSAHDAFFQPVYMTKSYYDEIDRAEAFARGRP